LTLLPPVSSRGRGELLLIDGGPTPGLLDRLNSWLPSRPVLCQTPVDPVWPSCDLEAMLHYGTVRSTRTAVKVVPLRLHLVECRARLEELQRMDSELQ
jgi:hypothetical protein